MCESTLLRERAEWVLNSCVGCAGADEGFTANSKRVFFLVILQCVEIEQATLYLLQLWTV